MIHSSHSRKDLMEICDIFEINIKNKVHLNKNELSRMLWLEIISKESINPDNNYFFINTIDELKYFLVNNNANKSLTIKQKEKIIENARRIISYSISGFNIQGNFKDINELISIAFDISQHGDISSVRRALKLLKEDQKINPKIQPIISQRVQNELLRKEDIKKKRNTTGLIRTQGNFSIRFD